MPKFDIVTLGCKVNQYESETISKELKINGWNMTKEGNADICIINTCTVTGKASMQSRQEIRKIIKKNPNARIIVTGCYAQTEACEIEKIKGVDFILGNKEKDKLVSNIFSTLNYISPALIPPHKVNIDNYRTRPFLKIQDGCNAFCTYCIIPYARGKSNSMAPDLVFSNIKQLSLSGYHEVVLTGIHIGCYGQDLIPPTSIFQLLKNINNKKLIDRIRLSSIEPMELNDEIIELFASSKRLCNHFHIPLQSGDNQILKRMHRPYTQEIFKQKILKINQLIPDATIGIDVLIGFPGETEKQFNNTYSFLKDLPITYLHVFPFSKRKNTPAAKYKDQISPAIIKERCSLIRELGKKKKKDFYKNCIGKNYTVLIENKRDRITGLLKGVTSNYINVLIEGNNSLKNSFCNVILQRIADNSNGIYGDLNSVN